MSNNPQKKQVFSVSQKYNEVFDILDSVDNKSEFICQAIIEKYKGSGNVADDILEEKIKKVLKNIISEDNLFIVSGNVSAIPTQPFSIQSAASNPSLVEEVTETEEDEDDDYLKSVFKNM